MFPSQGDCPANCELFHGPTPIKVVWTNDQTLPPFEIRRERLKSMGLQQSTSYANMELIIEEL